MSTPPDSLPQRYGAPSRGSRLALAVVVGVAVLAFLGWVVWATAFHADPPVSSQEIGHDVVDDHAAWIKVNVSFGDGPVDATCSLRAIAADKTVVGETSFHPDRAGTHKATVRTDRRATTVEWLGCTAKGQPRPQ